MPAVYAICKMQYILISYRIYCVGQFAIYYFIIKMASNEMNLILSKYHDKVGPFKIEHQTTKRKSTKSKQQPMMMTFMDHQSTTPKQSKQSMHAYTDRSNPIYHQVATNEEISRTLKHLNETEKALAISQRNYAQICRKLEKLRVHCSSVEQELQKERKNRLQELIDLQNRLRLLETENQTNLKLLHSKQDKLIIFKQKLQQKDKQISIFERELEQISHKIGRNAAYHAQQSASLLEIEKTEAYILIEETNQKQLLAIQKQMEKFEPILKAKEQEKNLLLHKMQELTNSHKLELTEMRNALIANETNYRQWLQQAKNEKVAIILKYEASLRANSSNKAMQQQHNSEPNKQNSHDDSLQLELTRLKTAQNKSHSQIQQLTHMNKVSNEEISHLQIKIKELQNQYVEQVQSSQKLLNKLMSQEEANKQLRELTYQLEHKIVELKAELANMSENKINQQSKEVKMPTWAECQAGERLTDRTQKQLNINDKLTETTIKLKHKINSLELEIQNITTELYAERLNSAKLKLELTETKEDLKRQYELSLENTKRQLIQQVRGVQDSKSSHSATLQEQQKQIMHLEMSELQRKYEMLKSEIVTVNEMSRMVTKIHKFHSKKK